MSTTTDGEELVELIWANDVKGIKRLAPIAGPDYFVRGAPPLAHAVYADKPEAAQALIDAGAYAHWKTVMGENLVQFAARNKKPRMAEFFISQGVGNGQDAAAGTREANTIGATTRLVEKAAEREMGFNPITAFEGLEGFFNNYPSELNKAPSEQRAPQTAPLQIEATIRGIPARDTLNIRSGPGINYEPIGELNEGDEVTVTGRAVMNGDTDWYPVRMSKGTGWVRGRYLQRK